MKKPLAKLTHLLVGLSLTGLSGTLFAGLTTFNDLTPGQSVNGQGGWTVEGPFNDNVEQFDEDVVTIGPGNNAWRISNSTTQTLYSNQPYSSKSAEVAGETGAGLYNDYGPNGAEPFTPPHSSATATSHYFYGGWEFKSATDAAQGTEGSVMSIAISPGASYGAIRMSYLAILDDGTGFSLLFYETSNGDGSFDPTVIATGLSYDEWHKVQMYVEFVDGVIDEDGIYGNDIVNIVLNDTLIHTGTSWESYYYETTEGGFTPPTPQSVDSLLFRMSGAANVANEGNGFLFDNVETSNIAIPEPSQFALALASVAVCLIWWRRK